MGKFEKGQYVRVLHTDYPEVLAVGDVFKVGASYNHGVEPEGENSEWFFLNGEVEDWQPKVGEKVEVTYGHGWNGEAVVDRISGGNIIATMKTGKYVGIEGGFTIACLQPFAATTATLTIEAGKFYKTRDGRKVGPMDEWISGQFREKAGNGRYWLKSGEGVHEPDLIAEWVDEQPAKASNDNAEPTLGDILQAAIGKSVTVKVDKPKFKVGDKLVLARSFSGSALVGATATVGMKGMFDSFVDVVWNRDDLSNGQMNGGYFPDYFDLAPSSPAIVCLIENGQPKPSTYPHVHADEGAASKEAARLASVHNGQKFGVYVLTQTVSEEKVVSYQHEWQRLAIKGDKIPAIRELRSLAGLTLRGAKDAVEAYIEYQAAA